MYYSNFYALELELEDQKVDKLTGCLTYVGSTRNTPHFTSPPT